MHIPRIAVSVTTTLAALLIFGCTTLTAPGPSTAPVVSLKLAVGADEQVQASYAAGRPVKALHFSQSLGGYRQQDWHPEQAGFRWVAEGTGERIERIDGGSFDRIGFRIPMRYRALPKSYAPFSPFSDGSVLIHSGQFHVCVEVPCNGVAPLPVAITAPGKIVGVEGRRVDAQADFVSRDEGTNIFVGLLMPVTANGFVAVIDPGLPDQARDHLARSLPRAMENYAAIYGPLSFRPELYVSIDARPRPDGRVSTQGGTLPGQVFMHFDGQGARQRVGGESPYWLDWFFSHEAAHLFQQDKVGKLAGDETAAWIHEGGADAMAALDLAARGDKERAYVVKRIDDATTACAKGLEATPLGQASARGEFDLHYQCGLLIWLALDGELRRSGKNGLHSLNRAYFARVRHGAPWSQETFLLTAKQLSVPAALIGRIEVLNAGGDSSALAEVNALRGLALPLNPTGQ